MTQSPKLAALAVVLHQDRALLVRRKNPPDAGLWGFPGGHVEWGETVGQAAIRELREETGVSAMPLTYLPPLDVVVPDDQGGTQFHFLLAPVLCRYQSGKPVAQDDVTEAAWIDCDQITREALQMSANVAQLLRDAMARLGR